MQNSATMREFSYLFGKGSCATQESLSTVWGIVGPCLYVSFVGGCWEGTSNSLHYSYHKIMLELDLDSICKFAKFSASSKLLWASEYTSMLPSMLPSLQTAMMDAVGERAWYVAPPGFGKRPIYSNFLGPLPSDYFTQWQRSWYLSCL